MTIGNTVKRKEQSMLNVNKHQIITTIPNKYFKKFSIILSFTKHHCKYRTIFISKIKKGILTQCYQVIKGLCAALPNKEHHEEKKNA